MKKPLLLTIYGIIIILCVASCQPLEVSAYCITSYDRLKKEYLGLPESYIGFCISSLQSGEFRKYEDICEDTSTWAVIETGWFGTAAEITTADECNHYFNDLSLILPNS